MKHLSLSDEQKNRIHDSVNFDGMGAWFSMVRRLMAEEVVTEGE
jgi:hypothetical protein